MNPNTDTRRLPWDAATLARLAECTRALRRSGARILSQSLGDGRPQLLIDRAPGGLSILGGRTGRALGNGHRQWSISVCGCDVRWEEA